MSYEQLEDFAKAKYVRRTGSPGNYKYEYAKEKKDGGGKAVGKTDSGKPIGMKPGYDKDFSAEDHDDARYAHKQAQTKYAPGSKERTHHEHMAEYHNAKNYEMETGNKYKLTTKNPFLMTAAQRAANEAGEFFSAPKQKPKAPAKEPSAAEKTAASMKEKYGVDFTPVGKDRLAFTPSDVAKLVAAGVTDLSSVRSAGADKMAIDISALKKSEDNLDLLKSYAGMPSCEPKMVQKKGADSPDGGEVAGAGTTSGADSGTAGPMQDKSTGQVKADSVGTKKLSEDDADDEAQMKPHTKPIEKIKKSEAVYNGTPQSIRDTVAHANAVAASRLRKGQEYITHGQGIPAPAQAPETLEKAHTWNQGADSRVRYSNASDLAVDALQKSQQDSMYTGAHLGFGQPPGDLRAAQLCKSKCGASFSKALSVCPSCGADSGRSVNQAGVVLSKAMTDGRPFFTPRRDEYLTLPNGVRFKS